MADKPGAFKIDNRLILAISSHNLILFFLFLINVFTNDNDKKIYSLKLDDANLLSSAQ